MKLALRYILLLISILCLLQVADSAQLEHKRFSRMSNPSGSIPEASKDAPKPPADNPPTPAEYIRGQNMIRKGIPKSTSGTAPKRHSNQ